MHNRLTVCGLVMIGLSQFMSGSVLRKSEVVRIALRESQETKCVRNETISVIQNATIYLHIR